MSQESQAQVDVEHVAMLARLELSDAEKAAFSQEINETIGYIAVLQEVDVDGVEPMAHATHMANVVRPDLPGPCQDLAATLANAPETVDGTLIRVPVVLGESGGSA